MNVLDFFKRNSEVDSSHTDEKNEIALPADTQQEQGVVKNPEIPENVFIEYAKPKPKPSMDTNEVKPEASDLQTLYRYLEQNLEKKGYEDALINPDTGYMEEQVLYINNELALLISKIKTYYAGYMRTIDFHIETRQRSGMIETVDELIAHKETVAGEMKIVLSIEEDSIQRVGLSQNPILSYRKGFRNGFAAITYNTVLSRKN